MLSESQRRAHEVALAELGGKQPFWTGLDEIPQQIIAGIHGRGESVPYGQRQTGVEERKAWQKALNGVRSVALSKWPKHSNANKFKGLRWAILRRIELMGFKIEKMVDPNGPHGSPYVKNLNYFGSVCELGHRDIALLIVKSGSVDINGKDEHDQTPLFHASMRDMIEVVRALVEAGQT